MRRAGWVTLPLCYENSHPLVCAGIQQQPSQQQQARWCRDCIYISILLPGLAFVKKAEDRQ
jgi:hypothetical protein